MSTSLSTIAPIRFWDIPTISRMVYRNMRGVDVDFTRLTETPLRRALSYLLVPLYLLTAGKGYKAIHHGEVAGCGYYLLHQKSGFVFNVGVNAAHRRQGVASGLMRFLEREVRRAGRAWIGLQVDEGNLPAQHLYRQLGYIPYHSYFLHSSRPAPPLRRAGGPVDLISLSRRQGSQAYFEHLRLEQEAGDSWAAAVVASDYKSGPPAGGRFWQIEHAGEKAGVLWLSFQDSAHQALLLLEPRYWGAPLLSEYVYGTLVAAAGKNLSATELHFGSSAHYEAALDYWQERGFLPRRRPRILMLKSLSEANALR